MAESGPARIFMDPEPERGAHWGYRGTIRIDELGAHIDERCEWLYVNLDTDEGWPTGEWEPVEVRQTIPWHRIHSISWGDEYVVPERATAETTGTERRRG